MQKIYFLISIFLFGLTSGLITNESSYKNNQSYQANNINIADDKYLALAYSHGQFFSWNQSNSSNEHVVGIFTDEDNKSYLLNSNGVFINLDYNIINFTRINDTTGIAQLSSYVDSTGELWTNKNYIVEISSTNEFSVKFHASIKTQNHNFLVLNDNTFFTYGIGLEVVTFNDSSITVTTKVPAYDGGYTPTSIYLLDNTHAIFVNGDGQVYYITDILGAFVKINLNIDLSTNYNNNIEIFDSNHFLYREPYNNIIFFDLTTNTSNWLNFKSVTNNFCFKLNNDEFIINTSNGNASNIYGVPIMLNVANLYSPIALDTIDTLSDIILNNSNEGIMITGSSLAYKFQLNSDKFTFNSIGNIDSYQYINQTLGFASVSGNNLLLSANINVGWLEAKSIVIKPNNDQTVVNYLNNIDRTNKGLVDHTNSYFANDTLSLDIKNKNLINVIIVSSQGRVTLTPTNEAINYNFTYFTKYKITINFGSPLVLDYQITIDSFDENKLFNINGSNIRNYVGITNNQLYDIQAINEDLDFSVTAFDYDLLQSVQLIRYDTNLVIRNISNIKENETIKASILDKFIFKEYLCSLKVENLLNQAKMIYLGFIKNDGTKPLPAFWDTNKGEALRKDALLNNYTNKQLDNMNANAIRNLLQSASTWKLIKVQATTLAFIILGIIVLSTIAATGSSIYNLSLNKKIKKMPIKKG